MLLSRNAPGVAPGRDDLREGPGLVGVALLLCDLLRDS
jgi:hypothetical protein